MAWRIGVDIGGTFTDVAMVEEETGRIGIAKVPTTPLDFAEGVLAGLAQGLERQGIGADAVTLLSHATTIVTNALLEKKGANCAFVGTRGHRDVLELRRSVRIDLYDLEQDAPPVIIPRESRFEITERVDAQGDVVTPLDESEVPALVEQIRASGAQTVAVSFLFSFLNPAHEQRVGELLRAALPDVQVFLSSDVLPEIREFERASTTAVCAYVGPLLESYLKRLSEAVGGIGLPELHVMGSSGGVVDIAECLRMPAQAVESGPAAGVIAAALAGEQLGLDRVLSFDMGGTTAKASVIVDGEIQVTAEYEVGGTSNAKRWLNGSGHPIRVPVVDLAEVSSGGGSIAWVDLGGALKVGPHSAGSLPGPVAYGRGGTKPTVTDANVILGYLNPVSLLDGELKIDRAGALRAMETEVGAALGLSAHEAAQRVVEVVNANMTQALRIVSVERGLDPTEFTLMAFGGAGAIHAIFLAEELGVPSVVVPPAPGVFSALGLVTTNLKRDWSKTVYADLAGLTPAALMAEYAVMEADGLKMLEAANVPEPRRKLVRQADVRYRRQAYELTVNVPEGPLDDAAMAAIATAFHEKHRQTYGHANEAEPVQLVNIRLSALGLLPSLRLSMDIDPAAARRETRPVWFPEGGEVDCPVIWRDGLAAEAEFPGPAIVESLDATTVVPPGWTVKVDADGFLHARRA
ncbi:hydantoinase/oxoprolinase family protein [uncultured Albimonas sp.]|uniref:hydantoinase/oxoprolinase family protein n=1 Tax=uncultured Albimonas sp. TaxID=1331701 RepID=UPI0030EC0F9B